MKNPEISFLIDDRIDINIQIDAAIRKLQSMKLPDDSFKSLNDWKRLHEISFHKIFGDVKENDFIWKYYSKIIDHLDNFTNFRVYEKYYELNEYTFACRDKVNGGVLFCETRKTREDAFLSLLKQLIYKL